MDNIYTAKSEAEMEIKDNYSDFEQEADHGSEKPKAFKGHMMDCSYE